MLWDLRKKCNNQKKRRIQYVSTAFLICLDLEYLLPVMGEIQKKSRKSFEKYELEQKIMLSSQEIIRKKDYFGIASIKAPCSRQPLQWLLS